MTEGLDEKFLEYIISRYKLKPLDAALRMDDCIRATALIHKLDYNVVYNSLFTEENLKKCLLEEKVCNEQTVDDCINSCNCFYLEPYGCLPRKFPDADKINEDPDKYIIAHFGKTEDLKKAVAIASYLYYNYDAGGLTDNSYDALEYYLKKKEKIKGRAYEKIGALPVEKIRVNLDYPLASLIKVKPGTVECTNFLHRFDGGISHTLSKRCIWSLKLDGVSGMLTYENNKLTKINTRGDGVIGGNVFYLNEFIKTIPHTVPEGGNMFVVRGEFIITIALWEQKYKGSYSNARAFVSGKINSGFISAALHDIDFVAYEIMSYNNNAKNRNVPNPTRTFEILNEKGFTVVNNGFFINPTVFEVMETYKSQREKSKYYIDGLVLSVDEPHPYIKPYSQGGVLQNPDYSVAFKMLLEAQVRDTKVINIEYNISRLGKLIPKAIYEAVYIDGARMTKATAFNAKHIVDWNMGVGTKIKVFRSGDVIPQIKKDSVVIDPSTKIILPKTEKEGGFAWHWEGSDIVLDDIENNRYVQIKRMVHFFETVGIPRLGKKTIEKMYDTLGFTTAEQVVRANVSDFVKMKGVAKKTGELYYNKIREVMSEIPPDRFIVASSTFESGIGKKSLKIIFKRIPNILDLSGDEIAAYFKKNKIPGFAAKKIAKLVNGIPAFRNYLNSFVKSDIEKSIANYTKKLKDIEKNGKNKLIAGKKFVETGFMGNMDYDLEDYIYDHDGDFVKKVTKDVSAVIVGSMLELNDKTDLAFKLGIPILNVQEFIERYNIPVKKHEKDDKDNSDD